MYDDEDSDDTTIPCPECGREIYDDTPRCPHCGSYLGGDDFQRSRRPAWWLLFGVLAALAAAAMWIFR